jgi:hypothetical protein
MMERLFSQFFAFFFIFSRTNNPSTLLRVCEKRERERNGKRTGERERERGIYIEGVRR